MEGAVITLQRPDGTHPLTKQPLAAAQNIEALELLGKATADNLHTLGEIYAGEQLMDLAQRAFVRAIREGRVQALIE